MQYINTTGILLAWHVIIKVTQIEKVQRKTKENMFMILGTLNKHSVSLSKNPNIYLI